MSQHEPEVYVDSAVADDTKRGSDDFANGAIAVDMEDEDPDVDTVIEVEPVLKKIPGSVMSFHNLSYTVEIKKMCCGKCRPTEKKTILNDVNGILRPGLNALMGSTGSGKSTLLDALANRKDPACTSGKIFLDGKVLPKNFQYLSGYVTQNDLFVATISVRETLWFCANLRLPTSVSKASKKRRIDQVLDELGLIECADTKIGNDLIRGISGGEKKRTSIASELILEPKILFLDEPTTGLDSATAWSVVSLLKRLGDHGHTIICSIHQPRYSIFKMFDTLTMLSKGELVFHGESNEALPFFESLGYECEAHDNPADFFLDVLNGGHEKVLSKEKCSNEKNKKLALRLRDKFRKSEKGIAVENELKKIEESADQVKSRSGKMYATGFLHQMKVLLGRTGKHMLRNPQSLIGNALIYTAIGLVFGLIFYQVDRTPDKGIQNRLGILFFINTNLMFSATMVIENFVKERNIFIHEHVSGYYSTLSYFLSKVLADLVPLRTITPIILCTITYWMVGLKPDVSAFFIFLLTAVLAGFASVGIGLFYSATFRPAVGHLVLVLTFICTIIFSGLLVNVDTIMPWLSWLKYLSVARYGLVALSINELSGEVFSSCSNTTATDPLASFFGGATANFTVTMANETACVYVKGDEFLSTSLALPEVLTAWDLWQNHVALSCIIVGLYSLTYFQLTRINTYS